MANTNYYETFILVADDCPAEKGVVPVVKEGKAKPIHAIQYELMAKNPYGYTQEEILFRVYAERNNLAANDREAREKFFQKSHPCLRSSALGKKYGWGIHFDANGRAALYARETTEYARFAQDTHCKKIKALRNKRA